MQVLCLSSPKGGIYLGQKFSRCSPISTLLYIWCMVGSNSSHLTAFSWMSNWKRNVIPYHEPTLINLRTFILVIWHSSEFNTNPIIIYHWIKSNNQYQQDVAPNFPMLSNTNHKQKRSHHDKLLELIMIWEQPNNFSTDLNQQDVFH